MLMDLPQRHVPQGLVDAMMLVERCPHLSRLLQATETHLRPTAFLNTRSTSDWKIAKRVWISTFCYPRRGGDGSLGNREEPRRQHRRRRGTR
jgi:hypothetical protein